MEKHLIMMTVCTRVEPDVNVLTKPLELARNHKARLWMLDAKGGRRDSSAPGVDHLVVLELRVKMLVFT